MVTRQPPPPAARALALLALAAGSGGAVWSVAVGEWDGGRAPTPYAWAEVAAVQVGCAVPLALVLALLVTSHVSSGGVAVVAAASLAAGLVGPTVAPPPVPGDVLRPAAALLTLAGVTLAVAVCSDRLADRSRLGQLAAPVVLGVAALVVPPATFVDARCQHDLARLGELVGQSRVGEARTLARGLTVLNPGREWNGRPVGEAAADLDRIAARLEQRVAAPLRETATPRDRVDRGVTLAMLGRTDEALDVLAAVDDPRFTAEVGNLRGTIHEARGEWADGLVAYRAGRVAWEGRPADPARDAGILRAATGVAYCLRKEGRYAEAGAAYREVLALSPTADSHFLLAQFYEDAQQAGSAREHARRAAELAPGQYGDAADRLVARLAVYQFGCLGVYTAAGQPTGGVGGAVGTRDLAR